MYTQNSLSLLLVGNLDTSQVLEVDGLQHLLGVTVNHNNILLNGRALRDKVQSGLTLLLLQLQGDAANRASLDALHQVGDETGDLVSHSLGRNDGNFASDLLVDMEIKSQARVVLLDDHSGGLLNGLSSDTHVL